MEVSGAAPDWALVRELAPLLCCRMAWTTQIGQRLGPFRGGQGLAGGCDCVPDAMPMQCTMHCQLISHLAAGHWQPQKPPSGHHPLALFWVLFWVVVLSHYVAFHSASRRCMPCMYVGIHSDAEAEGEAEAEADAAAGGKREGTSV
jgi:hypothetical protein